MVALIFRYGESQFSYGFVCVWHNSFTSWGYILWSTTLSFCGQPQTHYVINPTPVLCNLFTIYFTVNNTPLLYSNAPPFCGQQYILWSTPILIIWANKMCSTTNQFLFRYTSVLRTRRTSIQCYKNQVVKTPSGTNTKCYIHQVVEIPSRTNTKLDKHQVGLTPSGTNIKWNKHQVGQTNFCGTNIK